MTDGLFQIIGNIVLFGRVLIPIFNYQMQLPSHFFELVLSSAVGTLLIERTEAESVFQSARAGIVLSTSSACGGPMETACPESLSECRTTVMNWALRLQKAAASIQIIG